MEAYNLRIVNAKDLNKRSYISYYLDGKRKRTYNGKSLGLPIHPNRAATRKDKKRQLQYLRKALLKSFKIDHYPETSNTETTTLIPQVEFATDHWLDQAIKRKQKSNLSFYYLKNLSALIGHFKNYLSEEEKNGDIRNLPQKTIQGFLDQYASSGTNYMNRRTELSAIFALISRQTGTELKYIQRTEPMKRKASLHRIYEGHELQNMLHFLKQHHEDLYLCCLICYGCFLRPHQEIRTLKVSSLKHDCTEIHLSGSENKTGRIRIVYLPAYLSEILRLRIKGLAEDANLFTGKRKAFNRSYFHTRWQRLKPLMYQENVLQDKQTIYSFRHTAAVNVYRKTKDASILQKLMGHSDMMVTLRYLRSLGESSEEHLRNY